MLKRLGNQLAKLTIKKITAVIVVALVAGIGVYLIVSSHAATPYVSVTATSGVLSNGAINQTCTTASNGSCVVFEGSSGAQTDCFKSPGSCGYPDPIYGNVGVPAGTQLTPYSGTLTITTAGTVVKDMNITGNILIEANNVTVEDSKITTPGNSDVLNAHGDNDIQIGTSTTGAITGTKLTDDELTNVAGTVIQRAIYNYADPDAIGNGLYIHSQSNPQQYPTVDTCSTGASNTPGGGIDGSWYGNGTFENSYSVAGIYIACDHIENVYEPAASSPILTVEHDTLLNPVGQTANVFIDESLSQQAPNFIIEDNLMAGGGFSIYGGAHAIAGDPGTGTVSNDRFARCSGWANETEGSGGAWLCPNGPDSSGYYPRSGNFGLVSDTPTTFTWCGNYWDDSPKLYIDTTGKSTTQSGVDTSQATACSSSTTNS